jgi:hypothetical protein
VDQKWNAGLDLGLPTSAYLDWRPEVSMATRSTFRRYVRLHCEVVRARDLKRVGDLALDLSTSGIMVRSGHRVLTGEEVIVTFRPPRSNRSIDACGTVVRVIHGRRPSDRFGNALGIAFEGMDADVRSHLFEQLRGLDPAEATRPPRPLL